MARCVHGVPLTDPHTCPNCAAMRAPICGVQEDSRRGWVKVCVLPRGHARTHPVKHQFKWMIGTPGADADPSGPGPDPDNVTQLPHRTPTPPPEAPPAPPVELGYRRRRVDRVTPPPRRDGPRVGFPLGTSERRERIERGGGGQFTSERESDQSEDDYASPTGKPLPAGVTGEALGRGSVVASIAETSAAMGGAIAQIVEARQVIHGAIERHQLAIQSAQAVMDGSGHEAAHTAFALLGTADDKLHEAIQLDQGAIDQLQTYLGNL